MGEGVTKRSQITGGGAPRDHIGYILEIFLGRGSHQKIIFDHREEGRIVYKMVKNKTLSSVSNSSFIFVSD